MKGASDPGGVPTHASSPASVKEESAVVPSAVAVEPDRSSRKASTMINDADASYRVAEIDSTKSDGFTLAELQKATSANWHEVASPPQSFRRHPSSGVEAIAGEESDDFKLESERRSEEQARHLPPRLAAQRRPRAPSIPCAQTSCSALVPARLDPLYHPSHPPPGAAFGHERGGRQALSQDHHGRAGLQGCHHRCHQAGALLAAKRVV